MADGSVAGFQSAVTIASGDVPRWARSVQTWHYEMCQRGQRPELIHFGWMESRGEVVEQIMCDGRYDHERDCALWTWKHEHEEEVKQFLRDLGSYRDVSGPKIPPSSGRDLRFRVAEAVQLVDEAAAAGIYFAVNDVDEIAVTTWFDYNRPRDSEGSVYPTGLWQDQILPRLEVNRRAVFEEILRRQRYVKYPSRVPVKTEDEQSCLA